MTLITKTKANNTFFTPIMEVSLLLLVAGGLKLPQNVEEIQVF